jgi:hypothetical protein
MYDDDLHLSRNRAELRRNQRALLEEMLEMTAFELSAIVDDDEAPSFRRGMAKMIMAFQDKHEPMTMIGILDQIYGKPTERVEVKHSEIIEGFVIPTLSQDDILALQSGGGDSIGAVANDEVNGKNDNKDEVVDKR